MERAVIVSEAIKSKESDLGHEQGMDVEETASTSTKNEYDGAGVNSPYFDIPIGLLRCTICDMSMTDGPVSKA